MAAAGSDDRIQRLEGWLAERGEEMTALLIDLIGVPTENPPGHALGACARLLAERMRSLGLDAELIPVAAEGEQDDPHVVRAVVGEGERLVYFHGHFDVVPAQSPEQFHARRHDGSVVGRGSADMKGGLVSMIYAAAGLADLGLIPNGRLVLHLVCDEETGSTSGSKHLVRNGMIDSQALVMLTPEPTSRVVWHASRGAITLRVTVTGRGAHVGLANQGINAFEHSSRIGVALGELAGRLREQKTAFATEDGADGSMLVVGGASGSGANFNAVPASAWFSVDRRFNPEEDLDVELTRLVDTVESAAAEVGASAAIELLQRQPSASTSTDLPVARALAAAVAAVEGAEPRFELCPGVLDTRWYAQLGVPAFAYGPGRLDISHGPEESVEEAALGRCALVYARVAGELLA